MQRWLSISLIFFYAVGPLAAALPASDDSRLPSCCRRHGEHHCAMMMRMKAKENSGKPIITAPSTCPLFPGILPPSSATRNALAAAPVSLPVLFAQAYKLAARFNAALRSPMRSHAGRGPPHTSLS